MTHPARRLDNAVHQRTRLGILTVLAGATRVDFAFLRDTLGLTDGNLSRNLSVLEAAGYIAIDKTFEARRSRTWIAATPAGRRALAAEVTALREIVQTVDRAAAAGARLAPRTGPARS
ncbi:MAG TPA: transcriptional regulator [Streptosporangiaceae bacterium]|jgi:DNA-binding MarR family transcriptional regulator